MQSVILLVTQNSKEQKNSATIVLVLKTIIKK